MSQYKRKEYDTAEMEDALSQYNEYSDIADFYNADLQTKKEIQRDSNYINIGRGLGAILGSLGGYVFGSEVYANTSNHNYGLNPVNATGALVGAGVGASLGNYLTFKTLAKNRGVDDRFSLRHFRKPAQLAALQGLSAKDQSKWNDYDTAMEMSDLLGVEYARKLSNKKAIRDIIEKRNNNITY